MGPCMQTKLESSMQIDPTSFQAPWPTIQAEMRTANAEDQKSAPDELTEEEKRQVAELKKRDREVKAHEQAHMAAGAGVITGGATYEYTTGPDGKAYAVGGEVSIDVSPAQNPEATIRKMEQIQRAALAPAQPSTTDRAVAAQAAQMAQTARMELSRQEKELQQEQAGNASQRQDPAFAGSTISVWG